MTRLSNRIREFERICAETYQAVGVLAHDSNRFFDDGVTKVLDNLSMMEIVHEDILPSDQEAKEAKQSLDNIKNIVSQEDYNKLKTILDYFS